MGGDVNIGANAGANAAENNSFSTGGAVAGCAVGASAGGVGCIPAGAAGAVAGLAIDAAIALLIAAGILAAADIAMNQSGENRNVDSPSAKTGASGAISGSPDPEENNNQEPQELTAEQKRAIRSYEKRIAEHEAKLLEFKNNPTVRLGMEGQTPEII